MNQKMTLKAMELLVYDRQQEILEKSFQDRRLIENAARKAISHEWLGVEHVQNCIVSFFRDFHPMRELTKERKSVGIDMMRRAGEPIVNRLYHLTMRNLENDAHTQAENDYPDFKEMRKRYESTRIKINATKRQNRRTRLAAMYGFTEERLFYANDVDFMEMVTADDFKSHIEVIRQWCHGFFRVEDAVDIAVGLLTSNQMKGRNFRNPAVDGMACKAV